MVLFVPSVDADLAGVELLAVRQPPGVAHDDGSSPRRDRAGARHEILHVESRRAPDHRVEMHAERRANVGALDVARRSAAASVRRRGADAPRRRAAAAAASAATAAVATMTQRAEPTL